MQTSTKQNNGMAIASLILAIVGLLTMCFIPCLGIVLLVPAFVTGYIGYKQIKASGGTQGGDWMAIVGMVIGGLGGLLVAVAIVAIAMLALMGPQIANIFSRVTSGLSGP